MQGPGFRNTLNKNITGKGASGGGVGETGYYYYTVFIKRDMEGGGVGVEGRFIAGEGLLGFGFAP
ncbi:unnamed protein product [Staurois parvus]|uniref:Uncharacterized protein n=1 Tax=Staurois parvus TaxID=386267 RepID=A0ABN9CD12_9NEOB|nr:unnamed protein product [Staurois parvus]